MRQEKIHADGRELLSGALPEGKMLRDKPAKPGRKTVTVAAGAKKGPCFQFPGGTYLEFKLDDFNITDHAHFSMLFKTVAEEGVVLYAEGPDDYEAVFLSQGKIHYLIANPSPSGVEGTSGGYYVSDAAVNNGTWLRLDLWRNWPRQRRLRGGGMENYTDTGMVLRDVAGGGEERHLDNIYHRGIEISSDIFIGGVRPTLTHVSGSTAPPSFEGMIKEMEETRNERVLSLYYLNKNGLVKRCP
ncbi:hypothetical protein BaRGS_00022876 [Batillaria attramentaria]|uniref:Laminin G domain-containing protein n=1 Tax=Batillaria attramentaria TaxID=370345 RepID=A0ABD0KFQ3_9CAEN